MTNREREFGVIGAKVVLNDPNASPEWKRAAEKFIEDAESDERNAPGDCCEFCDGTGIDDEGNECEECDGSGEV